MSSSKGEKSIKDMKKDLCKICRRFGQKLFLKGERCFLLKCAMIKKPYPPGMKTKKRKSRHTEYGKQLAEKQKLKISYGLSEKQFKKYVSQVLKKRGRVEDEAEELIKKLEKRLDNVIYRLGIASSRKQARQLVSHGFFLINGKPIDIPSYEVRQNDVITLKKEKLQKNFFKEISAILKKKTPPSWLKFEKEKFEAKVIAEPSLKEMAPIAEISVIFEFYSR